VEVLLRLNRELEEIDKERFKEILEPYIKKTSENFIYDIKAGDIPHHLEKLGEIYQGLYELLRKEYKGKDLFQIFERVYREHFKIVEEKIQIKSNEELNSSIIQSPDDIEATYRKKNGPGSKGQTINVFETANPDNPIELLTDVTVHANNIDDSSAFNSRIDKVIEKTSELEELHSDAAYGSRENDKKLEDLGITLVQTAIRGRESGVSINIEEIGEDKYRVSCPNQTVISEQGKVFNSAKFEIARCKDCVLSKECITHKFKKHRTYYFTREEYLKNKRSRAIDNIPEERRKLRNNVEATISEFSRKMQNKKLKVRGFFKAAIFAFTMAISINFGRIFRYKMTIPDPALAERIFVVFSSNSTKKQMCFQKMIVIGWIYTLLVIFPNNRYFWRNIFAHQNL
jgi:hypothetical protein